MKKAFLLLAGLVLAVVGGLVGPAAARIEGRGVALVIGNSRYVHAVALPNPAQDAALMAATLREAGFEVVEGIDLDKEGMQNALDEFTEKAYDANVGLIFYAGHGMQVGGKNYLIPIDAELTSQAHLKTRTIEAQQFLATLPPDPAIGILILDACRDNPLARNFTAALPKSRSLTVEPGLAPVQTTSSAGTGGTLIAYSTDPGSVALDGKGSNSPYTLALARYLTQPGVELQSALTRVRGDVTSTTAGRQNPWANSSLGREVFLGGPAPNTAAVAAAAPGAAPATAAEISQASNWDIERRLWDEASKRNSIPHFEAYLAQFPNGSFASIARLNIDQLKADEAAKAPATTQVASLAEQPSTVPAVGSTARTAVTVPEEAKRSGGTLITESMLGLTREAKADIQLRLEALGFDLGFADGSFGPRSRAAIAQWQADRGMVSTTFLTQPQYQFLLNETEPMMPAVRAQHAAELAARGDNARKTQVTRKYANKPSSQRSKVVTRRVKRSGGGGGDDFMKGVLLGAGVAAIGGLIGR